MVTAVTNALARSIELPAPRQAAAVVLTSDADVKDLNKMWRRQDKPTNVLSFPSSDFERRHNSDGSTGGETFLGDVILARETLLREAAEHGISPADHFHHLVLHGLLHLLGYDHEADADADVMEQLETRILASLGIADPHAEPLSR